MPTAICSLFQRTITIEHGHSSNKAGCRLPEWRFRLRSFRSGGPGFVMNEMNETALFDRTTGRAGGYFVHAYGLRIRVAGRHAGQGAETLRRPDEKVGRTPEPLEAIRRFFFFCNFV